MSIVTAGRDKLMNLVSESIYDNPVVVREMRTRMRDWKAFTTMGGYLLLVGGILFIVYMAMLDEHSYSSAGYFEVYIANKNIGQKLFIWLTWTQVVLLSLAIPALTFSSITQELERKTMELLALTRLSPGKIVLGKQLSGFLYSLVLMLCSLPLAGMCLMFGGISPAEIVVVYATLIAWAFLLTCLGVFWSSLFSRTASAALFAYGTMGIYFLFTMPFGSMVIAHSHRTGNIHAFEALNPGWAAYDPMSNAVVCGLSIPTALIAISLHVLMGVLFLLLASIHVRYYKVERALPIRLLVIAITLGLIWLLMGNPGVLFHLPTTTADAKDLIGIACSILLAFLCLAASAFATGPLKKHPQQPVPIYALSIRRTFTSDLGGAIAFMALWTIILLGGLLGTYWWLAKVEHVRVASEVWKAGLQMSLSILAIVVGVSAIGILGSCIVRLRRNAAAIVLLFVILIWGGYGIVLAYYVDGITDTSGPVWQLAAFWPMTPVLTLTGEWLRMPKLWWNIKDSWLVTSIAYFDLTALVLIAASRPAAKTGGVREE